MYIASICASHKLQNQITNPFACLHRQMFMRNFNFMYIGYRSDDSIEHLNDEDDLVPGKELINN